MYHGAVHPRAPFQLARAPTPSVSQRRTTQRHLGGEVLVAVAAPQPSGAPAHLDQSEVLGEINYANTRIWPSRPPIS